MSGEREYITREDDWLHCLCGNTPDMSGFDPCLSDGTEVEPDEGGPWGGLLYVCLDCGRIIDQDTLAVVGRRADLAADYETAAAIHELFDAPEPGDEDWEPFDPAKNRAALDALAEARKAAQS